MTKAGAGAAGGVAAGTAVEGGTAEVVVDVWAALDGTLEVAASAETPSLGAGMATKLARNAITYAMWAAVREATSLASAAGVDPAATLNSE